MTRAIFRFALVTLLVFASAAASPAADSTATEPADKSADKSTSKSPSQRWERDIAAFEAADKRSPPPKGAVLFIGSSSIRMWKTLATDFPDQKTINRGFGGSELADSVYYVDRIVIPYKPRLIVLFAGTNDINAGKSPETVFADFKAFVAKVRDGLPNTRIAYLSISPAPSRWSQAAKQKEANRLIRDYIASEKNNLDYIDLWDQFLGPDGKPREDLFLLDRLHNNAAGYKIRAAAVRPYLETAETTKHAGD
jgi:lysophospholipase L1-like esterase